MAKVLEIRDETTQGEILSRMSLVFESEVTTARTIIERRVREEVAAFNQQGEPLFRGLVQPNETERTLNGFRMARHRAIDPDVSVARALEAFEKNQFFLLVGERQVESLDEEVLVLPGAAVSFVKLVPLVGG